MNLPMKVEFADLDIQPKTVEEYKKVVIEKLKKYDYVITDENRKEAEQDKKLLQQQYNKLHADRMSAYKEFDAVKKEMIATENLIKNKVAEMTSQINELDAYIKEEKQMEIAEYYASREFNLVPLEKIWDNKWLNKTCNNWSDQIDEKINKINQELELINNFGVSDEEKEEIKGYYLECLNVMQARTMFDKQKERREAIKKQQGENKKQVADIPQTPYMEPVQEERHQEVQQVLKQRIVVEFVATREFFDYMNKGIKEYKPQVKVIEREEVK